LLLIIQECRDSRLIKSDVNGISLLKVLSLATIALGGGCDLSGHDLMKITFLCPEVGLNESSKQETAMTAFWNCGRLHESIAVLSEERLLSRIDLGIVATIYLEKNDARWIFRHLPG
jgi:hypothetical protein